MPNLVCVSPECDNALPKGKRKYCSDTCKWREQKEYIEMQNKIENTNQK